MLKVVCHPPRVLWVVVAVAEEVRLLVGVEVAQVDLLQRQAAVGGGVPQAEQGHQVLPAALRIYLQEKEGVSTLYVCQPLKLLVESVSSTFRVKATQEK